MLPRCEERSTTVKKRPSREPEHASWALTLLVHEHRATTSTPHIQQRTTTVDSDPGLPSRHRCRVLRAWVPTTCPRAQPGHRGEWAPPNHLLAPTAGVGSSRPPTTRQNANSCKDGVRRVGNFLHGKHCPPVLCACDRTRRGERGVTKAAGSHARPPLWAPTGGVVAERCPGGVDGSRVARILVLYSTIACAAHPDIRGHAPPPRGRVAAFRRGTRPLRGGVDLSGQPRARRLTGRGDPMRASIRGSDIHCQ